MPVPVSCPKCQARCAVPEQALGKYVRCGNCQQAFLAAAPAAENSAKPVAVSCPKCLARCAVPEQALGKRVRCGNCQEIFQTAAPAAGAAPAPPPAKPASAIALEPTPPRLVPQPAPEEPVVLEEASPEEVRDYARASRPGWLAGWLAAGRRPAWLIRSAVAGGVLLLGILGTLSALWLFRSPDTRVAQSGSESGNAAANNPDGAGGNLPENPAAPPALVIKPSPLKADKESRPLPGTVGAVALGGGGRFLFLHLPAQRQLAVFDVNEAKVVKYLPVAEDNPKFAAGAEKLVVYLPGANVLQRWDLATLEREVTVTNPVSGTVHVLLLGSASRGPLVIGAAGGGRGLTFLDPLTFKELEYRYTDGQPGRGVRFENYPPTVRISADGRVLTMWTPGLSPSGLHSLVLEGRTLRDHYEHTSVGYNLPGPDGKTLFTPGQLYTAELKPLGQRKGGFGAAVWYLPAAHGKFYLSVNEKKLGGVARSSLSVAVHLLGDERPLVTLPQLDGLEGLIDWQTGRTSGFERHVHFIPDAKLIVVLPSTNDKLQLFRFDLDEALEKSGIDYLYVASTPPQRIKAGSDLVYQVQTRSKKGGVKYKLESGPPGMTLTPAGRLSWRVPADHAQAETDVLIAVSDVSGQEVFHTFKLALEGLAAETVTRELPSTADDLIVGGAGRFLLLNLPQVRKVALFDVNEARVVHYFPVSGDGVRIAAGLEKLVMVFPGSKILQRWSLLTREREITTTISPDNIRQIVLGSASQGPLVLAGTGMTFLDLKTLKPLDIKAQGGQRGFEGNIRVSADGTVFGLWATGLSPSGLTSLILSGNELKGHYQHTTVGHIAPGPDGRILFTGTGLFTNETKPFGTGRDGTFSVPAVEGSFYLAVRFGDQFRPAKVRETAGMTVHVTGDSRPLATLPLELGNRDRFQQTGVPQDKRIQFIPAAKLLVTLPQTNDRLIVRHFDVEEAMDKAGVDYLFVASRPPQLAPRGKDFVYPMIVKSKKGGLQFSVEAGPEGLKVTKTGVVVWKVPADMPEGSHDVIVTVRDMAGQEIFHTFKVTVVEKVAAVP